MCMYVSKHIFIYVKINIFKYKLFTCMYTYTVYYISYNINKEIHLKF